MDFFLYVGTALNMGMAEFAFITVPARTFLFVLFQALQSSILRVCGSVVYTISKPTILQVVITHLEPPFYQNATIIQVLSDDIEAIVLFNDNSIIILASDLNLLCTDFLERDYGLVQLVNQPTHGNNILDKFFCSRSDIFSASVSKSLIKTKHQAVLVQDMSTSGLFTSSVPKRKRLLF